MLLSLFLLLSQSLDQLLSLLYLALDLCHCLVKLLNFTRHVLNLVLYSSDIFLVFFVQTFDFFFDFSALAHDTDD